MVSDRVYEFDVAISYAIEDSDHAQALIKILRQRRVKVFDDKYVQAELWGKNLYDHLTDVYQYKAHYCVMFLSKNYAAHVWTNLERQAAQARAYQERREYILPVRLDDTAIPGILPTVSYLSIPPEQADTIASAVMQKLGRTSQKSSALLNLSSDISSRKDKTMEKDTNDSTFENNLVYYVTQAQEARKQNLHHDHRRELFLSFLREAFHIEPNDIIIEQYIQLSESSTCFRCNSANS